MPISDEIRSQLAHLASSRRTREAEFSRSRPTHWAPREVVNLSTGAPFTDDEAWELVRSALSAGVDVEQITLEVPAGKAGYVLHLAGSCGEEIYVKLQLGSGVVIGRSFHVSRKG